MRSFEILPGDSASRVILHVPHASRHIPTSVRDAIALPDQSLGDELDAMTDALTDQIASLVAAKCAVRPWIFVNRLSRLVIDPERFPDDREEMNAVGMGAVYTKTSSGADLREADTARDAQLIDQYFTPYAVAFEQLVTDRFEAVDEVTIIDVHSFPKEALPYELHSHGSRSPVCIGSDDFHTPRRLELAALRAFTSRNLDVSINSPFTGCYVPLSRYGVDDRVRGFMVELRRDVYLDETGGLNDSAAATVSEAMSSVVDEIEDRT